MSVDLSTRYLGLKLSSPLVVSASPLTAQLHCLERLVEAGAAAAVLPSLFEEQIAGEQLAWHPLSRSAPCGQHTWTPDLADYNSGPDSYLRHITAAKRAVSIPIIASLNGSSSGDWVQFAHLMEEAGADALELNVYFVPVDPDQTSADVESQYADLVAAVRAVVQIPLAVKLGPYFSALPNMARRLVQAGADGLVLFNRYLQPDVDLETLEVSPNLVLSSRDELRLPLRWIAILRNQVQVSLAATSGVHFTEDVVKLLLVGADVTMLASALIRNGPDHLQAMNDELRHWFDHRGLASIDDLRGTLCRQTGDQSSAFERVNYMKTIASASE